MIDGHSTVARVRRLGRVDYHAALAAMRDFNAGRGADDADELWLLEHPPVYTRGVSCRAEPHRNPRGIPVVDTDRGGQITYHAPGQLIAYLLFDLKRRGTGVKRLVSDIEQAVIDTLAEFEIHATRRDGAPGVYVDGRKVAALGLRVRRHLTSHGLSLNLDMDREPFTWIDPCGYAGLDTVNVSELAPGADHDRLVESLASRLLSLSGGDAGSERDMARVLAR